MDQAAAPNHGFEDSRRLTGPNRYFGGPAVTLTPLGAAARNPAAHADWATRVRATCAALEWPDPQPRVEIHTAGATLVFGAPRDVLFTATEINEWAWERAAALLGESAFDLAQDIRGDPVAVFAARAASERVPALVALCAAAAARAIPLFEDDVEISLGAGAGSRRWARDSLPALDAVPWDELSDVPTALVTGSNGKTTTVRLIAAAAAAAGLTPGFSCTEGVFVDGRAVARGDYSGPDGAREVLRQRQVRAAILETARGGILRRGLAVQRADAAVVTNISADHFGEYGIDSAADLAETKLAVAHAVQHGGTLVLNADDTTLMSAAARLPHAVRAHRALFAQDYAHPALLRLRSLGGSTCGVRGGRLLLSNRGEEHVLGEVAALPLTLGGAARHNVANLAAAALAAAALAIPIAFIGATLRRFGATPHDNPGRLECWRHRGARVLIDYAHNPDGLAHLLEVARSMQPKRLFLLLGQAGNRSDAAIADLARTAARFAPDRIVIKELVHMLRGRAAGEVPALLEDALLGAGLPAGRLSIEPDEESAARTLLDAAQPGDVIVLPVHTVAVRERLRELM